MDPLATEFAVFGYGSLLFEPIRPDLLVQQLPARLGGYCRALNKRSRARGCARAHSRWPETVVPSEFVEDGWTHSLAMGTQPHPEAHIDGLLMIYPGPSEALILELLDAREGFIAGREATLQGYLREEVTVDCCGQQRACVTYLSNSGGRMHYPSLSDEEGLAILRRATPLPNFRDHKHRGQEYVRQISAELERLGCADPHLQRLVECFAE